MNLQSGTSALRRSVTAVVALVVASCLLAVPRTAAASERCEPACVVSGTVRDSQGQPVAGVRVQMFTVGDPWTTTDANGHYAIPQNFIYGPFRIGVTEGARTADPREPLDWSQTYYPDAGQLAEAEYLSFEDDHTLTGIDLVARRGSAIYGRTVNEEIPRDPSVEATLFRKVTLDGRTSFEPYTYRKDFSHSWSRFGKVAPWPDGRPGSYYFGGLPPGTYRVGVDGHTMGHQPGYYGDSTTLATAADIVIGEGEQREADFLLRKGPELTGRLVTASGVPLPDVEVFATRVDDLGHGPLAPYASDSATTRTDVEGRYVLDVAPGSYRTQAANYKFRIDPDLSPIAVPEVGGSAPDRVVTVGDCCKAFYGLYQTLESGALEPTIGPGGIHVYRREPGGAWSPVEELSRTYSQRDGHYTVVIANDGASEYTLGFGADEEEVFLGGHQSIESAETVHLVDGDIASDLDWFAPRWAVVSAIVSIDGAPNTDWVGQIEAYRFDTGQWRRVAAAGRGWGPLGRTEEMLLLPGTYRFKFAGGSQSVDEFWEDAATIDEAIDVTVAERDRLELMATVGSPPRFTQVTPSTVATTPAAGEQLSLIQGSWQPSPTSSQLNWLIDGEPVPGATQTTFTPLPEHTGHELSVRERVWSGGGPAVEQMTELGAVHPARPGKINVRWTTDRKARLTWRPVPGADAYRVVVISPEGRRTTRTTTPRLTISRLVPGATHQVVVRALHAESGTVSRRRVASVTTEELTAPANLRITRNAGGAATVAWKPPPGAVRHTLRLTALGQSDRVVELGRQGRASLIGLDVGTQYQVTVEAYATDDSSTSRSAMVSFIAR